MKPDSAPLASIAPSPPSTSVLADLSRDVMRKVAASPSAEDFAREAGAEVRYEADGSWVATVRGEENMRRAVAMQDGVRAVDVEMGRKAATRHVTETIVDASGRQHSFPASVVERVAIKRGWRPKVNWGRPKERWVVRGGELVRVI